MKPKLPIEALNAERTKLCTRVEELHGKSQATGLEEQEQAEFDELVADDGPIHALTLEMEQAVRTKQAMERVAGIRVSGDEIVSLLQRDKPGALFAPEGASGVASAVGKQPFALQDSDGNWHTSVAANQPLAEAKPAESPSAGQMLAFWATNDESHLGGRDPRAAITGHGGGESGGFLLPSTIAGELVDLARSAMVTGRAGVRSINLQSAETKVVRVTKDPTPGFVSELGKIPSSGPAFDSVVLRPHKLGVLIPVSREAIEDGANLPGVLEQTATAAIANAIDKTVLAGAGGTEPRGILNTKGVNRIDTVGIPSSYSHVLNAVRMIHDANYAGATSELAWVHSPREWETYAGLSATDGQPLMIPPAISDLPAYSTTSMPVDGGAGENESSMIVGHFPSSLIGYRAGSGIRVEFFNAGHAAHADGGDIDAVANDATLLRLTVRFDVAVLRPDHFTILSGVTA